MNNLHFLDPGDKEGKPVLLIHGLGVDSSSWIMQFPPLMKAGFRPIAVDVPGFGRSPHGNERWSIDRVSKDISNFLREMLIFPIPAVGLSMGGTIAQQIYFNDPILVSKLVLANTFSVLRPGTITGWFYFFQRLILVQFLGLPAQAEFVAKKIFPNPDQEILRKEMIRQIIAADPRAYRAAMFSLGSFNSSKKLPGVKIPTLVITGGKDTTVSPAHQTHLAKLIPGSQQVVMKRAGHAASVEYPDEFNGILIKFLVE
jgi:3-oxoadipate enol-lactonase